MFETMDGVGAAIGIYTRSERGRRPFSGSDRIDAGEEWISSVERRYEKEEGEGEEHCFRKRYGRASCPCQMILGIRDLEAVTSIFKVGMKCNSACWRRS